MRYHMMHNNVGFIKYNNNTTYYITYNTINLILPDNDQMKTSGYFSDLRITFAFGHYLNLIWKDFLVLIKLERNGIHLYLAQGLRGNAAMPCYPGPTSRYFYSRCSPIIPKCCGNLSLMRRTLNQNESPSCASENRPSEQLSGFLNVL